MKILILANSKIGLYNFRKELIDKLKHKGSDVFLAYPVSDTYSEELLFGCRVINTSIDRRGRNIFKDYKLYKLYKKILYEIKPDLVITYTIKPNIYGGFACKALKIPYYVNITGLGSSFNKENLLKKMICFLYKKALKHSRTVFFENESNKNVFINANIINKHKAEVLNGAGVNLEKFNYIPLENEKEIKLLFIGRIMKEKGIDEFLYAAKKIKENYNNVTFHIIGEMEDNYKDVINEYVQKNIIIYYGFQNQVKSFVEKSHCVVLPSYHEGMSNALLEGAAMGRPLITSDINGCKEAVEEGINGYLCKAEDADSLYQCIKKFISLDLATMQIMGEKSRQRMVKYFDRNIIVDQTLKKLYNE